MARIILGKTADKVVMPTEEKVGLDPSKSSEQTFLKNTTQAQLHLLLIPGTWARNHRQFRHPSAIWLFAWWAKSTTTGIII